MVDVNEDRFFDGRYCWTTVLDYTERESTQLTVTVDL